MVALQSQSLVESLLNEERTARRLDREDFDRREKTLVRRNAVLEQRLSDLMKASEPVESEDDVFSELAVSVGQQLAEMIDITVYGGEYEIQGSPTVTVDLTGDDAVLSKIRTVKKLDEDGSESVRVVFELKNAVVTERNKLMATYNAFLE